MFRMNRRRQPKPQGSHEEEVAEWKRQQKRGMERSGRVLQEARPGKGREVVCVGSWRCVDRKHQAADPLRVTKSNSEAMGSLTRLRKKWTRQAQVSLHF